MHGFKSYITEISQELADAVSKKANTNKLAFDDIFGKDLRIAEPVLESSETKTKTKLEQVIENMNCILDIPNWVVYKKENFESKKNPQKVGKALANFKRILEKAKKNFEIKSKILDISRNLYWHISDEIVFVYTRDIDIEKYSIHNKDFEFILKEFKINDVFLSIFKDKMSTIDLHNLTDFDKKNKAIDELSKAIEGEFVEYVRDNHHQIDEIIKNESKDIGILKYQRSINTHLTYVDELLKISNLKSEIETTTSNFYIIYTRSPIDVVRMSDFSPDFGSCHGVTGSYFECAIADSLGKGALALLINSESYNNIVDNNLLQKEDLFYDHNRKYSFETKIIPLARSRIRLVEDSKGNQLPVPIYRTYGSQEYKHNSTFITQVVDWCKKKTPLNFNFSDRLLLRGGDYEDESTSENIKKIWGYSISYDHNVDNNNYDTQEVYDLHKKNLIYNIFNDPNDPYYRDVLLSNIIVANTYKDDSIKSILCGGYRFKNYLDNILNNTPLSFKDFSVDEFNSTDGLIASINFEYSGDIEPVGGSLEVYSTDSFSIELIQGSPIVIMVKFKINPYVLRPDGDYFQHIKNYDWESLVKINLNLFQIEGKSPDTFYSFISNIFKLINLKYKEIPTLEDVFGKEEYITMVPKLLKKYESEDLKGCYYITSGDFFKGNTYNNDITHDGSYYYTPSGRSRHSDVIKIMEDVVGESLDIYKNIIKSKFTTSTVLFCNSVNYTGYNDYYSYYNYKIKLPLNSLNDKLLQKIKSKNMIPTKESDVLGLEIGYIDISKTSDFITSIAHASIIEDNGKLYDYDWIVKFIEYIKTKPKFTLKDDDSELISILNTTL